jgi:hypothetical protein
MTAIAGMALMAVHNGCRDAAIVRQRLVAFQAPIDLMNRFPHRTGIHLGVNITPGFGAGHRLAQPTLPEPGGAGHLQRVAASQPRPKQNQAGLGDRRRGYTRLRSAVGDGSNQCVRKPEHFAGVGDQAAENGQPFLARKRFHSSSETSSSRRCISWNSPTAWRTGSCNFFGMQSWRGLPGWLCTRYSEGCPSPLAHRQLDLPHLLERSDSDPCRNRSPEAIWTMRERRPRSVAESSVRLRRKAVSCLYNIQDNNAKQEPKQNTNMLRNRTKLQTIMESIVWRH